METIPGVKAFVATLTVRVTGLELHHKLHGVTLFEPESGACRKTTH